MQQLGGPITLAGRAGLNSPSTDKGLGATAFWLLSKRLSELRIQTGGLSIRALLKARPSEVRSGSGTTGQGEQHSCTPLCYELSGLQNC